MKPGIFPALHGGGLLAATSRALAWLPATRPDGVQLHSDAEGIAQHAEDCARAVRSVLPQARLWVAVGLDGACSRAMASPEAWQRELEHLSAARAAAVRLGAECVVLDPEAAYKRPGDRDDAFARDVLRVMHAPGSYELAHTSYDVPTYHADYCWGAWLAGPEVDLSLPQVYPDVPHCTRAQLAQRAALHRTGYEGARRRGWLRPGLRVQPYYQAAIWDEPGPLVEALCGSEVVGLWPEHTPVAVRAMAAARVLRAANPPGPDCVRAYQRASGLREDGLVGSETLKALGLS